MRRLRPAAVLGAAAVLVALVALVAGCGVPVDDQPRDIPSVDRVGLAERPADQAGASDGAGSVVYLLSASGARGDEVLQAAPRGVAASLSGLLGALLAGPTADEQAKRLRTAVPSGSKLLSARVGEDGTATVDLSRAFDQIQGDAQRKAVAQIVFTATALDGVDAVRLLVEGRAREWPRGDGIFQREPLTRSAYPDLDPARRTEPPSTTTATATVTTTATTTATTAATTVATTAVAVVPTTTA